MMKKRLLLFCLLVASFQLEGQNDDQMNEMISSSIQSYMSWKNDYVKQGFCLRDTSLYYVCSDGLPSGFPYDRVGNAAFFSLKNVSGLPKAFRKKLNKGTGACFISMEMTGGQFVIWVSGKDVRLSNHRKIFIATSDWGIFTYKLSEDRQQWNLIKTEFGGI